MNPSKVTESKISNYFACCVYAVFEDIEKGTADGPPDQCIYQSYNNIIRPKKDQVKGLKGRFILSDASRQHMAFLFGQFLAELQLAKPVTGDSMEDVVGKAKRECTNCYTAAMFTVGTKLCASINGGACINTLAAFRDETNWFCNQLVLAGLPARADHVLTTGCFAIFNNFIKRIAYLIGRLTWYTHGTITSEVFLGTLAQQGMSQDMLDEIQSTIHVKPSRAKAVVTNAVAINAVIPVLPGVVPETGGVQTHVNQTIAPAAQPANDLADLLASI